MLKLSAMLTVPALLWLSAWHGFVPAVRAPARAPRAEATAPGDAMRRQPAPIEVAPRMAAAIAPVAASVLARAPAPAAPSGAPQEQPGFAPAMPPDAGHFSEDVPADADADEDEDVVDDFLDRIPEQAQWRRAWREQPLDARWTQQVRGEVEEKARTLLRGRVELSGLSCRTTICRMLLRFDDESDAQAFMSAAHESDLHHEYQPTGGLGYELLINRPQPEPASDVAAAHELSPRAAADPEGELASAEAGDLVRPEPAVSLGASGPSPVARRQRQP